MTSWCIPELSAEYVCKMEDVLELYAQEPRASQPVVCFDERPVQLVAETRAPIPPAPGRPARVDYEYRRAGVANLFVFFAPQLGWRHVWPTARRTKLDFARCLQALVDTYFPYATTIHVVLDNLNTHTLAALYEAYPPAEARRIARKFALHYTPKHGSWLNQAEAEIALLSRLCLSGRRIDSLDQLRAQTTAWEEPRNQAHATVHWRFTAKDARKKLRRLYPAVP